MTIQEEYELSCYQTIAALNEDKKVYLVKNVDTNHIYIKKIINIYNKSIYNRLMNLNIRNIPRIYVCIEDNDRLIVIEEYIHGNTLEELHQNSKPITEKDIVSIMIKLCDILWQLHHCFPPIIHRDIKPSNIIVSADNVIKLIDFNAAKEFDTNKSEDTIFMGTRHFAAPEQYGFNQSDARTDIYAIGCTIKYLTEEMNHVHPELKNVINKCMQIDAGNRYSDVMELQSALKCIFPMEQPTEHKASFCKYLPVGFRSLNPPKMILASLYYVFVFWLSLSLTMINSQTGQPYSGLELLKCKTACLIMGLFYPFFLCNYLGIRHRIIHFTRNRVMHWLLCCIFLILFSFVVILLSAI